MAKKGNTKTIALAGILITIIILSPLLLLFAGIEVPIIGTVYSEAFGITVYRQVAPNDFQVPVPDLTPEEMQENEEIMEEIDDLFEGGDDLTNEECVVETVNPDGSINVVPCENNTIDEMIGDLEDMLNEPDPIDPNLNGTTSTDTPIDQIEDQIIPQLQLLTSITKIDSNGNAELVEDVFDIPLASFFVEEETNIDYSTGRLEIKLSINGDPTTTFMGTGKVDLLINNQSILSAPLDVQVDGMGEVDLMFGGISDTFTFSFADNFDKFLNQQGTPITIVVKELNITGGAQTFSLTDQTVFVMSILRDDFRILIVDEQGITMRVYPTDSIIRLTTTSTTPSAGYCTIGSQSREACGRVSCGACSLNGVKTGTYPDSCRSGSFGTSTGTILPTVPLTGINLFAESGEIIVSGVGGTSGLVFDELVTRNENYTLKINSPSLEGDLSYGKSQETQSKVCQPTFSVSYKVTKSTTAYYCGSCPRGGTPCLWSDSWRLVPVFTETGFMCNFDK